MSSFPKMPWHLNRENFVYVVPRDNGKENPHSLLVHTVSGIDLVVDFVPLEGERFFDRQIRIVLKRGNGSSQDRILREEIVAENEAKSIWTEITGGNLWIDDLMHDAEDKDDSASPVKDRSDDSRKDRWRLVCPLLFGASIFVNLVIFLLVGYMFLRLPPQSSVLSEPPRVSVPERSGQQMESPVGSSGQGDSGRSQSSLSGSVSEGRAETGHVSGMSDARVPQDTPLPVPSVVSSSDASQRAESRDSPSVPSFAVASRVSPAIRSLLANDGVADRSVREGEDAGTGSSSAPQDADPEALMALRELREVLRRRIPISDSLFRRLPADMQEMLIQSGIVPPEARTHAAEPRGQPERLPTGVIMRSGSDRNNVPFMPRQLPVGVSGRIDIPMPGGGDLKTEDDFGAFGLQPMR